MITTDEDTKNNNNNNHNNVVVNRLSAVSVRKPHNNNTSTTRSKRLIDALFGDQRNQDFNQMVTFPTQSIQITSSVNIRNDDNEIKDFLMTRHTMDYTRSRIGMCDDNNGLIWITGLKPRLDVRTLDPLSKRVIQPSTPPPSVDRVILNVMYFDAATETWQLLDVTLAGLSKPCGRVMLMTCVPNTYVSASSIPTDASADTSTDTSTKPTNVTTTTRAWALAKIIIDPSEDPDIDTHPIEDSGDDEDDVSHSRDYQHINVDDRTIGRWTLLGFDMIHHRPSSLGSSTIAPELKLIHEQDLGASVQPVSITCTCDGKKLWIAEQTKIWTTNENRLTVFREFGIPLIGWDQLFNLISGRVATSIMKSKIVYKSGLDCCPGWDARWKQIVSMHWYNPWKSLLVADRLSGIRIVRFLDDNDLHDIGVTHMSLTHDCMHVVGMTLHRSTPCIYVWCERAVVRGLKKHERKHDSKRRSDDDNNYDDDDDVDDDGGHLSNNKRYARSKGSIHRIVLGTEPPLIQEPIVTPNRLESQMVIRELENDQPRMNVVIGNNGTERVAVIQTFQMEPERITGDTTRECRYMNKIVQRDQQARIYRWSRDGPEITATITTNDTLLDLSSVTATTSNTDTNRLRTLLHENVARSSRIRSFVVDQRHDMVWIRSNILKTVIPSRKSRVSTTPTPTTTTIATLTDATRTHVALYTTVSCSSSLPRTSWACQLECMRTMLFIFDTRVVWEIIWEYIWAPLAATLMTPTERQMFYTDSYLTGLDYTKSLSSSYTTSTTTSTTRTIVPTTAATTTGTTRAYMSSRKRSNSLSLSTTQLSTMTPTLSRREQERQYLNSIPTIIGPTKHNINKRMRSRYDH